MKKKKIVSFVLFISVIAAIGVAGCTRKKTTTYTVKSEPVSVSYSSTQ